MPYQIKEKVINKMRVIWRDINGKATYCNMFDYCHSHIDDVNGTWTPIDKVDLKWIRYFVNPDGHRWR